MSLVLRERKWKPQLRHLFRNTANNVCAARMMNGFDLELTAHIGDYGFLKCVS